MNQQRTAPSSDWDGTLSAALIRSFSYLRHTLSSKHHYSNPPPFMASILNLQFFKSSSSHHHPASQLWFGILCALWYSSSALSSNTGKIILNTFKFPVTLTIIQFAFVAIWSGLFLILRHHLHSFRLHGGLGYFTLNRGTFRASIDSLGIQLPNRSTIRGTCIMSLFSITGHVFSSMAISRVPVSTVHTIKALSPLFTVIAYAGLFGVRYGFNTYFSLLPLTLGVMLACSFDMRANWIGFLCALGSTVIFVSQNIFGKKLLPNNNNNSSGNRRRSLSSSGGSAGMVQMDKLNLLFYSSAIAFLMMIPIWIYTDLSALLWIADSNDQAQSVEFMENLSTTSSGLTKYFVFNGTVHFAQCILAFSILSRTSPVTYSIASLIKRIAVICIAIVWFGQKVSILQGFGMILTFSGLYIYNQAKSEIDQGEKRRGILERKNDLLLSLPSTSTDLKDLEESDQILNHHSINEKPYLHHQDQTVRFENQFRRESVMSPSVLLASKHHHHQQQQQQQQQNQTTEQANSSGRGIDRTAMTTRQRAPSIPTPYFSSSTTISSQPNNPSLQSNSSYHSNHHLTQQSHSQLSAIPFNHNPSHKSNNSLKPSPLQESTPFRSIVNVR